MKLTIGERAMLLAILPREGNFDTLKIIRKFRESLSLSEAEKEQIRWRLEYQCPQCHAKGMLPVPVKCGECNIWMEPTGQGQWDSANDPNKNIFMTPAILTIIVSTLGKLNDKKQLTEELIPVYEKFINPNEGAGRIEDGT